MSKKIGFVGIVLMSILAMFSCDPLGLANLEVEEARLVFEGVIGKWEGKLSSSSISTVSTGKAEVEIAKEDFTKVLERVYPEKTLERNYKDLFDSYTTVYNSLEARLEDLENRVSVLEKDKKERDDKKISDKKADWTGLGIEDQLAFYLGWDMSGTGISIDLDLLTEKDIDKMLDAAQDMWDSSSLGERADFYTWERQHPIFDSSFNIVPQDDINEIQTYIDTEPERMEAGRVETKRIQAERMEAEKQRLKAERQRREAERQRELERKVLENRKKWENCPLDVQLKVYLGTINPLSIDIALLTEEDVNKMLDAAQDVWDSALWEEKVYIFSHRYYYFDERLGIITPEEEQEVRSEYWRRSKETKEEREERYRLLDISDLKIKAEHWDILPTALEREDFLVEGPSSLSKAVWRILDSNDYELLYEHNDALAAEIQIRHTNAWNSSSMDQRVDYYKSRRPPPGIKLALLTQDDIDEIEAYIVQRHNEHWNRLEMHDKIQYYTRKRSHFYIVLDLLTPDQIDEIEAYITVYGRH